MSQMTHVSKSFHAVTVPTSGVKERAAELQEKLSKRKSPPVGAVNVAPGSSSTKVEVGLVAQLYMKTVTMY